MIRSNTNGDLPKVDPTAYIDPSANFFVPSGAIVSSSDDVARLVSTTSKADREFSEKIVKANLALTKGYRHLKFPESV